ncbi:hypothetical protein DICPUDRAFT_81174 [Dictyostelium purpureum]|uniref:Uncharacterized protein n=1 Tax=Dictyostelium purpureum TaxID=5786 RepID=F0ZSQ2_DICPU|nr:uncharacterized protein DICPUDRAFT_81174 [Dictyostelium purpureum]EGC33015.1 hypothetical protein DICPUDRAFT_81174 [Dictyostelium purpureum]|eukprot:XP_003290442.1 hypothetical protein DICPUDRAFT_81174 [Dictyostelium purpureum]
MGSLSYTLLLFFVFVIYSNNNILFSNGEVLNETEYNCAYNIINRYFPVHEDKLNYFKYDNVTGKYDFCTSLSYQKASFNCVYQQVTSIILKLSTVPDLPLTSSDFSCFSNIYSFSFEKLRFEDNFINNAFTTGRSISFSSLDSPTILNFGTGTFKNFNQFYIGALYPNISKTYSLSQVAQVNNFFIILQLDQREFGSSDIDFIEYTNDVSTDPKTKIFISPVSVLPDLSRFTLNSCTLYLYPNFQVDSFSKLSTYTNIKSLSITSYSSPLLAFPEFPSNNVFNSFSLGSKFLKPNSLISLASFQSASEISFSLVGRDFHIDQKVPFTDFPSRYSSFSFSNGNIKNIPPYDSFGSNITKIILADNLMTGGLPVYKKEYGLKTLSLIHNQLTGTIDKSYCMIENFFFMNNSFSGEVPSCFTCHSDILGDLSLMFNNFTNVSPKPPCTTIILNAETLGGGNYILYGEDIGFSASNFKVYSDGSSVAISKSISILPNNLIQFQTTLSNYTSFTINYINTVPPIYIDVVVNNQIAPEIENIINNDNEGSFTLQGRYFSNNRSALYVQIGGNDCNIQTSTFSQINCHVANYDGLSRNLTVFVKMVDQVSGIMLDPVSTNDHYASSIYIAKPDTDNKSIATIKGWFGDTHQGLSIAIGDKKCDPQENNSTTIICTFNYGGSGIVSLNITQNQKVWIGKDYYSYPLQTKPCPNGCSKNGVCSKGECQCYDGYFGFDCASKTTDDNELPKSNLTVGEDSGSISINNQKTNFDISIVRLLETDLIGNVVRNFSLKTNWDTEKNENQNTWKFSQVLFDNSSIVYYVEKSDSRKPMSFAGVDFTLEKDSVKTRVEITNYKYQSTLNTLQLILESSVSLLDNTNENNNECNDKSVNIDSNNTNFITIKKDGKKLYSRIIDHILSDDRPNFMNTKIIHQSSSSLTLSLNLPHCINCIIDPDFSVLLSSDYKSSCKSKSYILPVAIVVPVVGVALIVTTVLLIKHKQGSALLKMKLSSFFGRKY